jgi:prolyl-tRNA synthetase
MDGDPATVMRMRATTRRSSAPEYKTMRLSRYFLPTLKDDPAEAQIASHRLMLRAGLVRQEAAGIYSWLPLGLRVLKRIERIVREELDRAGAIELLMPTLQLADLWRQSGRYDAYGPEMLRIRDRHERELLYGPTNEEMITEIVRASFGSYRDLPRNLYQIQWKFRDEQRPRFGVMRGREFLMKDGYSFDLDEAGARRSYQRMFVAYLRTFARLGVKAIPMRAETGPIGGDLSHEFIVLADTGESDVFCDRAVLDLPIPSADIDYDGDLDPVIRAWTAPYAATSDVHDAARYEAEVPLERRLHTRGIEVGQVFYFGTRYSQPMRVQVTMADGSARLLHGGSYGIGVSRLVGAIIEASHDEAGIVWPDAVAPFDVGLVNLKPGDPATDAACGHLEQCRAGQGIDVLHDDTDARAGSKFATMDLVGIPWQVVVGPRGISGGVVELKRRASGERIELTLDAAVARLVEAAVGKEAP